MKWYQAVEIVEPYLVHISTPRGSGTGFLIANSSNNQLSMIATAAHVIDDAHYWEEPIRITHKKSGESVLLRKDGRAIFIEPRLDTATIVFNRENLPFPPQTLTLAPKDKYLKVGLEIGWLGFPAIPSAGLCFFAGRISAWIESQEAYLVDGVTINGVSGGPAIHIESENVVVLMGVVSAYIPNRVTGETLPGLGVIRNVAQFHDQLSSFKSLTDAQTQQTVPEAQSNPTLFDDEGDDKTKSSKRAG